MFQTAHKAYYSAVFTFFALTLGKLKKLLGKRNTLSSQLRISGAISDHFSVVYELFVQQKAQFKEGKWQH